MEINGTISLRFEFGNFTVLDETIMLGLTSKCSDMSTHWLGDGRSYGDGKIFYLDMKVEEIDRDTLGILKTLMKMEPSNVNIEVTDID